MKKIRARKICLQLGRLGNLFERLMDEDIVDKWGHIHIDGFVRRFEMQYDDLVAAMRTPLADGKLIMRTQISRQCYETKYMGPELLH